MRGGSRSGAGRNGEKGKGKRAEEGRRFPEISHFFISPTWGLLQFMTRETFLSTFAISICPSVLTLIWLDCSGELPLRAFFPSLSFQKLPQPQREVFNSSYLQAPQPGIQPKVGPRHCGAGARYFSPEQAHTFFLTLFPKQQLLQNTQLL